MEVGKSRRYFCVDSIFMVDLLLSHHHSTQKKNLIKVSIGSTTSKLKLAPQDFKPYRPLDQFSFGRS